jgi:hypothetical protein
MIKHVRTAGKLATWHVTVRMSLSATCATFLGTWQGNAQGEIVFQTEEAGVVIAVTGM